MKKKKNIKPRPPEPLQYKDKKPFFSEKEIIFRSQGRAKVFKISSQLQVIFLSVLACAAAWSFYSYHMYHRSDKIIHKKDKEIIATRDAYVDLMTDFVTLHKNIDSIVTSSAKNKNLEKYKEQASVVEDKIKQITSTNEWVSEETIAEKVSLGEALLQRDLAVSERDELKGQVVKMEQVVEQIKNAELQVLDKVSSVTNKELDKIKNAITAVNKELKNRGLYYNALANKKKSSQGGPYIPIEKGNVKDKKINDKMVQIFDEVDDLEYYQTMIQYIPIGKPVWSYWVSSPFGRRLDPFKGEGAIHKGVDLASRTGNKVRTQAKGKVIRAEYSGAYGNLVEVDHGNGFRTKYAHMHKIYVKKGDTLNIDDTVGEVGSTGRSTGPHLHYEVLYQGKVVDPMAFIKAKSS